jgi:hypothetical protein
MAVQKNFVIRNGIEVNDNLLVADSSANRVGIGTTNPKYTLEVIGGIGATNFNSVGVTTSQEGFTSGIGVTNPVKITVSGSVLTFNVVGVGSTSLTLY